MCVLQKPIKEKVCKVKRRAENQQAVRTEATQFHDPPAQRSKFWDPPISQVSLSCFAWRLGPIDIYRSIHRCIYIYYSSSAAFFSLLFGLCFRVLWTWFGHNGGQSLRIHLDCFVDSLNGGTAFWGRAKRPGRPDEPVGPGDPDARGGRWTGREGHAVGGSRRWFERVRELQASGELKFSLLFLSLLVFWNWYLKV